MDCATAREAISAMADAEDPGADSGDVAAHLAQCAACRAWRDAAHEVTRRARLEVAQPVPARAREVAAAVRARTWVPRRARLATLARAGLLAIAIGQLAYTIPCLVFGHDHSAPQHIAREMGSFDAAVAAGFLVAAWRPGRALGMRAMVGVAAVLLLVTAAIDLVSGRTSAGDEAPHLLTLAGWLLVCYLAWVTPPAAARARPVPAAGPWSWLPVPLRPSTLVPMTPAAAASRAAGWAAADSAHPVWAGGTGAVAAAACGCTVGSCGCPGCAAQHMAAG